MGLLSLGFLALGLVAGFAMHRSGFCLAGAFRDWFLFRSTRLLPSLALLIALNMVLFEGARIAGILPRFPFLLLGPPNVLTPLGGLLFGVGMVLAGGCVVGTLYKLGAGSALAGTALAGLVLGSGLYAEIHPWWRALAAGAASWPDVLTVPQALGVAPAWLVVPAAAAGVALFRHGRGWGLWTGPSPARGYLAPPKAALALAVVSLASYLLAGMPLGITTCYAKIAATLTHWVVPEYAAGVAYYATTPLDASLEGLGLRLVGGPGPGWDAIAAVQGMTILGIVLGGFASAALVGEFRPALRAPARQYASALAGGVLLALGSRFSGGCNVWYLLGGLPVFALQSLLFVAGMIPGAWLGARLLETAVVPAGPAGTLAACVEADAP
ncbi:MAG: YeeE/YedE family protein [Thermodesulfobacteriota bacterium]